MIVKIEKELSIFANPLILLARLEGLEPPTCGLEVRCSIQLSYRREMNGGVTSAVTPTLLYTFTNFEIGSPGMERFRLQPQS
jgi:hypothetical protein